MHFCNFAAAQADPRIVGGEVVSNLKDFPYQVSIRRFRTLSHFCGGILLDSEHILTAAHCMFSENKLIGAHEVYAVTGSLNISPLPSSATTSKVRYIFTHEQYDPTKYDNDIAIMRLKSNITMNENTSNITLATSTTETDVKCIASGWGTTRENGAGTNRLMSVQVPIIEHKDCKNMYSSILTNNMICAGSEGKDACQGDSGGPLKCNDVIAGIVSFGSGCGQKGYPGVYTDVSKYEEWIETQIARAAAFSNTPQTVIFTLITLISLMYTLKIF